MLLMLEILLEHKLIIVIMKNNAVCAIILLFVGLYDPTGSETVYL